MSVEEDKKPKSLDTRTPEQKKAGDKKTADAFDHLIAEQEAEKTVRAGLLAEGSDADTVSEQFDIPLQSLQALLDGDKNKMFDSAYDQYISPEEKNFKEETNCSVLKLLLKRYESNGDYFQLNRVLLEYSILSMNKGTKRKMIDDNKESAYREKFAELLRQNIIVREILTDDGWTVTSDGSGKIHGEIQNADGDCEFRIHILPMGGSAMDSTGDYMLTDKDPNEIPVDITVSAAEIKDKKNVRTGYDDERYIVGESQIFSGKGIQSAIDFFRGDDVGDQIELVKLKSENEILRHKLKKMKEDVQN